MATRGKFPLYAILLVGIGLILAIFGVSYSRALWSERGTILDPSQPAEPGAAAKQQ
ncbi:hypothetical protein [Nannocystis radixulma]|uniref:Uncharacterized protein n=1 Tax=Nannocystis radixulma TaxID=2995305 RepID=A0ABT5BD53_9BACT|nr:hypothetical protein [Nannocystis radixulma]MDC0672069.1 hypothetical protein [Nannocystis radixulma]